MKKNKLVLRTLLSILGLMILGIGVSFIIQSNLGADPASSLQLGLAKQLGTSYGNAAAVYNIALLLIIFFVDKKYINISSILAIFVTGYTTQFMNHIFSTLNIFQMSYLIRVIICLVGCFIVSIGVTVYIFSDLGVAATDSIAEIISNKVKTSYRIVRVVSDLVLVLIGWSIGGSVGVGTIIIAIFVGPFIQFSRKMLYPLLTYVLDRKSVDDVNSDDKKFEKEVVF